LATREHRDGGSRKALTGAELEQRLEAILHNQGESRLNAIRDRARDIAQELGWRREFAALDRTIGALLGTRPAAHLSTQSGRARAAGLPFDVDALGRCQALFAALRGHPFAEVVDRFTATDHFTNKAFFEAYFSNYIEGTTFEIEEAEAIVFDKKIPASRPKDAHDILGTYALVSDPNEMTCLPRSASELVTILERRHRILMERRPEADPGRFKKVRNRAGSTPFVDPALVEGTLHKGFELYYDLPQGMARAAFIMFLIAEVHPFTDGNGRIARVMMNAELHERGLATIIIPNVFRDDYVGALRALSRRERPEPLIKMLETAQRFSAVAFSPYAATLKQLQRRNWFAEPDEARIMV
jgi:hypothetical protein